MTLKGYPALVRIVLAGALAAGLAACSMGGGGGGQLSPGLSAPMNQPGARLNRVEALFLLNDFRRAQGAADVREESRGGPQIEPPFCCQLPAEPVHRTLRELNPPHGISSLIRGTNRAVDGAVRLDFLERARIRRALQCRRGP